MTCCGLPGGGAFPWGHALPLGGGEDVCLVAESATVLPLGGGESSPLAGGSAKATLKRQPMTMIRAMPHLAWLGRP